MSAQTGTPSVVPAPPSSRAVDRARVSLQRAKTDPNPIWIRELKQAARLQRTPVILMTVTGLVALLMCSTGGIMSLTVAPASTGISLFHTFFSIGFFVVTLVGPALAANSVASEREGRTWEAVILTGLSPKTIARGKFLSAFTSISMYIVMLAPVGALSFLFGGVTAVEVLVAFVYLFLFALLSVAFGMSISSAMSSGRTAIVLTLLLAFPLTLAAYVGLGVALSFAAHELWPSVLQGPPVWLPTAYERAPFSLNYVTLLIIMPLALVSLPAWFFYEITVANLTGPSDDRSTGIKRWFAVMTPIITVAMLLPAAAAPMSEPSVGFVIACSVMLVFLTFCVFIFQGDAIGPSRRVLVHWDRAGAGALTRFFGPGLMNTTTLVLILGAGSLLVLGSAGVLMSLFSPHVVGSRADDVKRVVTFVGYALSYFIFLAGFGTWVRSKTTSPSIARVMLLVAIFFSTAGPWIVAAIAGIIAHHNSSDAMMVAAPSPFYAFVVLEAIDHPSRQLAVVAGAVCSVAWALLGLGLIAAASTRCKAIIEAHHARLAEADAMLAQEDAEQQQQAEPETQASTREAP